MSKIEEQVVAQQIEHLDFEPTCKVTTRHVTMINGWQVWKTKPKRCGRKATWAANLPCCGHVVPSCDVCHDTYSEEESTFNHCRTFPAFMITWSRI